jgi:hypothetical protein
VANTISMAAKLIGALVDAPEDERERALAIIRGAFPDPSAENLRIRRQKDAERKRKNGGDSEESSAEIPPLGDKGGSALDSSLPLSKPSGEETCQVSTAREPPDPLAGSFIGAEWAEGVRSVTGAPQTTPRGADLRALLDVLPAGPAKGRCEAARALGAEYAQAHKGRQLTPKWCAQWVSSGRPAPGGPPRKAQQPNPEGAPWLSEDSHG